MLIVSFAYSACLPGLLLALAFCAWRPASLPPLSWPAAVFSLAAGFAALGAAAGLAASIVRDRPEPQPTLRRPKPSVVAQSHGRILRKHQAVVPQQIVRLQARAARPASRLRDCGWRVRDCDCPAISTSRIVRVSPSRRAERLAKRLGLVRIELPAIHDRQLLLRPAWPKAPNAARPKPSSSAAGTRSCAAPGRVPCRPCARSKSGSNRRARGPCPSASRACGPSRTLRRGPWSCAFRRAAPPDTSAPFRAAGSDSPSRANTASARSSWPDVLAFQILDVHYRHRRRVLSLSGELFCTYFCASVTSLCAPCESADTCPPDPAPSRTPAADSRPCPLSRRADSSTVTCALPMCPGKCCPGHTRDGNELAPMPPGARWNIEPCVASPPR